MGPKFASKMKSDATPHGSRSALNVSRQSLAGVLLITAPIAGRLSRNPRPSLPGALAKGQLREIRIEDALIRIREKEEKKRRRNQQSQARTLPELQAIAKERGYSPGWAYHIYRSRNERGRFL